YLKASTVGQQDRFGHSVALSGDLSAVGAPQEKSGAVGVNGDESNDGIHAAGAAYVLTRTGGVWSQEAYLKASNTHFTWLFGNSVAVANGRVLVGASGERGLDVGIDADPSHLGLLSSGAAFLFESTVGGWDQTAYIKSSNSDYQDRFGSALALDGDMAVVGAWDEFSDGTGVNGDGSINAIFGAGAAYIFDLEASVSNFCGVAQGNSTGLSSSISMSGSLAASDNDFTLHAIDLPPNQFGYFLNSMGRSFVLRPGGSQGNLCVGGPSGLGRHNRFNEIGFSGSMGSFDVAIDLQDMPTTSGPVPAMAGETWHFQCWYRDMDPASTSNFSNGLSVLFE
ncbi:MAG: hypothetical protein P1V35_07190, partial [Planctomycetota bacterium]|nr:hypothetical protein [Planctomycetota bacterium]